MPTLEMAPTAVQEWFAARESSDHDARLLAVLSPDAVMEFAGRRILGAEAVVEHLRSMPAAALGKVEWQVLPGSDVGKLTVRGTGPEGSPLHSPGGPMSAIDFIFVLDDRGRIGRIVPEPHHIEPQDLSPALRPGQTVPDFELPDVYGTDVALHATDASVIVVVFTCNPCPWALGWHDRLQRVAREYAPRGLRFLQINSNDAKLSPKDSIESSRARVEAGEFGGPYLVDSGQTVARAWGARHTPDIFVVAPSGTLVYHGAADADVDDESQDALWLRLAITAVLNGTPAQIPTTDPMGCTIKWTLS